LEPEQGAAVDGDRSAEALGEEVASGESGPGRVRHSRLDCRESAAGLRECAMEEP
jgi:hypothetical protein